MSDTCSHLPFFSDIIGSVVEQGVQNALFFVAPSRFSVKERLNEFAAIIVHVSYDDSSGQYG